VKNGSYGSERNRTRESERRTRVGEGSIEARVDKGSREGGLKGAPEWIQEERGH